MNYEIPLQHRVISFSVPDSVAILESKSLIPYEDANTAVIKGLLRPIGYNRTLFDMAKTCQTACLVVDWVTPPEITDVMLRPVLKTLHAAGLGQDHISILVTAEYPMQLSADELLSCLPDDIRDDYPTFPHDTLSFTQHVLVGKTDAGTPVYLHRRFVDADMKIALGVLQPHFAAGFGGAPSLLGLGLTGPETVQALYHADRLESDLVCCGVDQGNAVYEELQQILTLSKLDFMLNVTLDNARNVTRVYAGHPSTAFGKAIESIKKKLAAHPKKQYDIVIVSAAEPRLSHKLYFNLTCLYNALRILKPNGIVILVSDYVDQLSNRELALFRTAHAFSKLIKVDKIVSGLYQKAINDLEEHHLVTVAQNASNNCSEDDFITVCLTPHKALNLAMKHFTLPKVAIMKHTLSSFMDIE